MELKPTGPPGRKTRKARAYTVEIQRLAQMGYTLADIRDTLQSVGVSVSTSTVHREARRPPPPALIAAPSALFAGTSAATSVSGAPHGKGVRGRSTSGRVAQTFFDENPSTSLLHSKEVP